MKVRDIMNSPVITVDRNESVRMAADRMTQHHVGGVPIVNDDTVVGMITDRDIITRVISRNIDPNTAKAEDYMSDKTVKIGPDESVKGAALTMSHEMVRRLCVTEEGKLVGIVSLCDLSQSGLGGQEIADAIAEIYKPSVKKKNK